MINVAMFLNTDRDPVDLLLALTFFIQAVLTLLIVVSLKKGVAYWPLTSVVFLLTGMRAVYGLLLYLGVISQNQAEQYRESVRDPEPRALLNLITIGILILCLLWIRHRNRQVALDDVRGPNEPATQHGDAKHDSNILDGDPSDHPRDV